MAEHKSNTTHPVVKTFFEYMPKPIIDLVSPAVTYVGNAHTGTAQDAERWLIERHTTLGTVTIVEYPNGTMEYKSKWTDRATLTYSR